MSKKLDEMQAGITPENRHAEVDFGEAVGMENIDDYLPRRLDEIVTRNRDQVEIRLATPEEVAQLAAEILEPPEVKDTILDWYPVTFRVREDSTVRIFGVFERRGAVSYTSRVLMLDEAAGLAISDRSIYRLGKRGEGEPPRGLVIALCALLNEMGVGKTLGVPEVFF